MWPFMLTANPWLDYRIVLLPQFINGGVQVDAFTAILDKCLQDDRRDSNSVVVDSPQLGKLAVWYEKQVANVDGCDLVDRAGRPIFRIQGVVCRRPYKEAAARLIINDDVIQEMRAKADSAFSTFRTLKAPSRPIIAGDLGQGRESQQAVRGQTQSNRRDDGTKAKRLYDDRSEISRGASNTREVLLVLAVTTGLAALVGMFAALRVSQMDASLRNFEGNIEKVVRTEANEVTRLQNIVSSIQADNEKMNQRFQELGRR